jgi:hypothetical protein
VLPALCRGRARRRTQQPRLAFVCRGLHVVIDGNALLLAAMAAGDVSYVAPKPTLGRTAGLGLNGLVNAGRPADLAAWKRVLATGAIMKSSM